MLKKNKLVQIFLNFRKFSYYYTKLHELISFFGDSLFVCLQGLHFHVTPSILPAPVAMREIIECAGGKVNINFFLQTKMFGS